MECTTEINLNKLERFLMIICMVFVFYVDRYTFEVGPVFTLMENEVLQTFCKIFGYDNGDGIFTPGGSISNM